MSCLEIKHLKMIKAIAETENLTRAAQRLHLSQPALSRQLLDIEKCLGAGLFHRSKKRMILTHAGARLHQSAESILQELDTAEVAIAKIVHGETGSLRIGVSCLFCFQWLPAVMAHFQKNYPKVDLAISTSLHCREDLLAKRFDMVVTATPATGTELDSIDLFKDELVAIAAPDHPLSTKRHVMPVDVSGIKVIVARASSLSDCSLAVWPGALIEPEAIMEIEQPHAIIELVKAGLGVSMAPRWAVASYLAAGQLAAIPIGPKGIHLVWRVFYLKGSTLSAFQQKFIDLMRQDRMRIDERNALPVTVSA
ncbi:MAG: LysR family transcriptional regulator [Desulfobacteraceae bacterium]|nr:LysR family transcriptional regulator [Desulfobacteraceae bacterium]